MDNKFYVSHKTERMLKEKGYPIDGRITKSEAIDWLDSKEVFIEVGGIGSGESQKWSYTIFDYNTCEDYASEYNFPTRLEAEEAAIIRCCEILESNQ